MRRKIKEVICPFCKTKMEPLCHDLWPVTPPNQETGTFKGGVWRYLNDYVCHGCGFYAQFWSEMHIKSP